MGFGHFRRRRFSAVVLQCTRLRVRYQSWKWLQFALCPSVYGFCFGTVFFPAAGFRNEQSGAAQFVGADGDYWSSFASGSSALRLFYEVSTVYVGFQYRARGFSLRCVQAFTDSVSGYFFPSAGYRARESGVLFAFGSEGYCWSSVPSGFSGIGLGCIGTGVYFYMGYRTYCFPLRCVQELTRNLFRAISSRLRGTGSGCRER